MLDQLSSGNLLTSLVLLPLAPFGIWLGIKLHDKINELWFYRFCYAFLLIAGLKLIFDGMTSTDVVTVFIG